MHKFICKQCDEMVEVYEVRCGQCIYKNRKELEELLNEFWNSGTMRKVEDGEVRDWDDKANALMGSILDVFSRLIDDLDRVTKGTWSKELARLSRLNVELQKNDGDLFCKIAVEAIAGIADGAIVAHKSYTGHLSLKIVKMLRKKKEELEEDLSANKAVAVALQRDISDLNKNDRNVAESILAFKVANPEAKMLTLIEWAEKAIENLGTNKCQCCWGHGEIPSGVPEKMNRCLHCGGTGLIAEA